VQAVVLPVSDDHAAYATRIVDRLKAEGFRAEFRGAHEDKLGKRIRNAKVEKVPYILVVGNDDVDAGTVGVNRRGADDPERGVAVDDFVERLAGEVTART
jgi:threonyl-tRNA synthetase